MQQGISLKCDGEHSSSNLVTMRLGEVMHSLQSRCQFHVFVTLSVMKALRQKRGLVAQLEVDHAARCRRGQCHGLVEEALEEDL